MVRRQIIRIDEELCTGCGECVPACAEGALEIVDGKARVVAEVLCDGLGACLGECPTGALTIEEREAPEFDEEAVERRLSRIGRAGVPRHPADPLGEGAAVSAYVDGGCPGSLSRILGAETAAAPIPVTAAGLADGNRDAESMLAHWPVQLALVNPLAPFFRNADLLVAADCTPYAYRLFHEDFLRGRSVVVACPKLDDAQRHFEKLVDLFQAARPRSVTVVRMEVPCCSGLVAITRQAAELAGLETPVEEVVITVSGGRQVEAPAPR
ncbi:MAG: 4Fe-4S binding protein [Thermoleophilia bacterium]